MLWGLQNNRLLVTPKKLQSKLQRASAAQKPPAGSVKWPGWGIGAPAASARWAGFQIYFRNAIASLASLRR
jgi:hypothetical protein